MAKRRPNILFSLIFINFADPIDFGPTDNLSAGPVLHISAKMPVRKNALAAKDHGSTLAISSQPGLFPDQVPHSREKQRLDGAGDAEQLPIPTTFADRPAVSQRSGPART
ncbi:MAG TPA: hypothetical protein VIJ35_17830, partial [Bradyrhizobium sp.]